MPDEIADPGRLRRRRPADTQPSIDGLDRPRGGFIKLKIRVLGRLARPEVDVGLVPDLEVPLPDLIDAVTLDEMPRERADQLCPLLVRLRRVRQRLVPERMRLLRGGQRRRHEAQLDERPHAVGQHAVVDLIHVRPVVDRLPFLGLAVDAVLVVEDVVEADVAEIGDRLGRAQVLAPALAHREVRPPGAEDLLPEVRERPRGRRGIHADDLGRRLRRRRPRIPGAPARRSPPAIHHCRRIVHLLSRSIRLRAIVVSDPVATLDRHQGPQRHRREALLGQEMSVPSPVEMCAPPGCLLEMPGRFESLIRKLIVRTSRSIGCRPGDVDVRRPPRPSACWEPVGDIRELDRRRARKHRAGAGDRDVARQVCRVREPARAGEDVGHTVEQLDVVRAVPGFAEIVLLVERLLLQNGRISTRQLCIGRPLASAT